LGICCAVGALLSACIPLPERSDDGLIPPERSQQARQPWGGRDAPRVWGNEPVTLTQAATDDGPAAVGKVLVTGTVDWESGITHAVAVELLQRDDLGVPRVLQRAWVHQPGKWRFGVGVGAGALEVWAWSPSSEGPPDVTDLHSSAVQFEVGEHAVRGLQLGLGAAR
jgi:hypothetical protein